MEVNDMERYTDMKDSETVWLGNIPCEWELSTISTLYDLRNEKVSDKYYEPLSVTKQGVVPQLSSAAKSDDSDNRKLVKKGDFAINSRSDRRGSCGISEYDGSVSLINIVLKPKGKMNPGYYNWLFHTVAFADEFYKWGHGIVDDLWTTRWQEMKQIVIPVPTYNEQQIIASYLDTQCSSIDIVIAQTRESIEDYKRWKFSLISETVTKGINPNVEMKSSGVELIGNIPINWDVIRFKYIATDVSKGAGITKEDVKEDGEIPCVRYGEIYTQYNFHFDECKSRVSEECVSQPRYFSYGDILFTCTGELVEEIGKAVVYLGNDKCMAGGDIIIASHKQNPTFLSYALNSNYAQSQRSCGKAKLKVVHASAYDINNTIMVIPPLEEQQMIATYLDRKCMKIDSIIAEKEALIQDLESYKKSLIHEVVTGKRKVV